MQNPGRTHWDAIKRIFRNLDGMKGHVLTFGSSNNNQTGLHGCFDADWASPEHWHSTSSYIFMINSGGVSWSSKKQAIVALSMTKAEYMSAMHAAKEFLWLCTFLTEITRLLHHPTTLFCDNQSAIAVTKDNQYHACMKHIDV